MINAEKFKYVFGLYATELWAMDEGKMLKWLNAEYKEPERKKGQWIRNDNGTYTCSVCQSWIPEEQHYYARYCLYCGADMRKKEIGE